MVRIYFHEKEKMNRVEPIESIDEMIKNTNGTEADPELGIVGILRKEFPLGYVYDGKVGISFEVAERYIIFRYSIEFRKGGK